MPNPVLVEVVRGAFVESRHRGAVAVIDADGGTALALGDVERPLYPRSAVKAFQALPLVESGAAERFGVTDAELALACASHSGEPAHVATAAALLAKVGRDGASLECGPHWPLGLPAARALAASGGAPTALHNNCSGKHAGFVCLACMLGAEPAGYIGPAHPVQVAVRAALETVTGAAHTPEAMATDGCSIPTYAVPLRALALGFARFGSGVGVGPGRATAAERLRAAVAAHPEMVAGEGRFDTKVARALVRRAFVKTGAEGVHCAALPELGLGLALKCDDGAGRAAEVIMAALILRFLVLSDAERAAVQALARPTLTNWNGIAVGEIRPSTALIGAHAT
jgi:L-asparaginase II